MSDKVIGSVDEFEDISLDIDLEEPTEVKDETPISSLPQETKSEKEEELNLSLDDLDTSTMVEAPVPTKEPIHNDLVKPNPIDEIDIELDMEETLEQKVEEKVQEIATTQTVEKKKRGRKSKAEKEAEESVVENTSSDVIVLDPLFSMASIDNTKYQTRAILHTEDEIKSLKESIESQGQIEPIHLYFDGTTHHLLAGFKRYEAVKALGKTTIKAIIHTNLTEEECISISSGTNSERTELSEYDKIVSVGLFNKKNPIVSIDRMKGIFGFATSTIYQYISHYKFFSKNEEYNELFSKFRLPHFVYGALYKVLSDEEGYNVKDVIEYLKDRISTGKIERKTFESDLISFFSEARLDARIKRETEATTIDADLKMDDDIPDPNLEKMINEKKVEAQEKDNATTEKTDKVNKLLDNMIALSEKIEIFVDELIAIEGHKEYIDTTKLNVYVKKIGKIAGMNIKFI